MLAYTDYEDKASMLNVGKFDAANKLLPAIVLIISILRFRCKLKSKHAHKIFAIEKLMIVHIAIFLSFVIIYAAYLALFFLQISTPNGSGEECRLSISAKYFGLSVAAINILTLTLFIYMSLMFSKPLTVYWREFLVSYRNQSISQAI